MRRAVIVTVSLYVCATGLVALQDAPARPPSGAGVRPPTPPRDTSAPPQVTGVAAIFGRVTAADAGTPVRGAIVTAWPSGGSASGRVPVSARVGDDGRYRIDEVPAGEYSVMARHPAYLTQGLGQTTPRTPERRLMVTGGALAGPLDFPLLRGAAISGRVVDEFGEPVERVQVRASKLRRFANEWRLVPHGDSVQTDDLGQYRLHGLPPGEYVVGADPPRQYSPTPVEAVDRRDLVPTWAPGTHSAADAQRVRLEPGGEGQADVQLAVAGVASIAGRAVDSGGQPLAEGTVRLHARGGITGIAAANTSVSPDGLFHLPGVAPGSYTLVAEQRRSSFFDPRTGMTAPPEIGVVDIDVVDEPQTAVVIRTEPGATIRGRLVVDGDAASLAGRQVFVVATPTDSAHPVQAVARGRVAPDLSFELPGARGRVQLRLTGMPDGWWTRAVRRATADVTNGLDIGDLTALDGVNLLVSTRQTAVKGMVKRASGAPADAVVVLFSQDERRWEQSVAAAGLTLVRPVEDGSFRTPTVRPGPYYVIALAATDVKSDELGDPDYLRELAPHATRIDVAEGQVPELALIVP